MRIVLDTNILARVLLSPDGLAAKVFEQICAAHVLVVSPELLRELTRVLSYERIRRVHRMDATAIAEFVASVEAGSLVSQIGVTVPRVVPDDLDDDVVVATAVAGSADILCTRNRHLRHPSVLT